MRSSKDPAPQVRPSEYPEPLEEQPLPPAPQVDESVITDIGRIDIGPPIGGFPGLGHSGPPEDSQGRPFF
jgi:hypothetical protein